MIGFVPTKTQHGVSGHYTVVKELTCWLHWFREKIVNENVRETSDKRKTFYNVLNAIEAHLLCLEKKSLIQTQNLKLLNFFSIVC